MAGRKQKPETKIILDYIERFPNASIQPLARKIIDENPGIFENVDRVIGNIRYYMGTNGAQQRKTAKTKKFHRDKNNQCLEIARVSF